MFDVHATLSHVCFCLAAGTVGRSSTVCASGESAGDTREKLVFYVLFHLFVYCVYATQVTALTGHSTHTHTQSQILVLLYRISVDYLVVGGRIRAREI